MFFHFCHFPIFIFSVHNSVQWWSLIIYLSKRARAAWIEILSQNIAWTGALLSQILWHDRMLVGILILIVKGNALTNFQLQRPTLELLKETLGSFLNGLNLTVNWAPIKSIVYDHILSFIICIMSWEIFTPFYIYLIHYTKPPLTLPHVRVHRLHTEQGWADLKLSPNLFTNFNWGAFKA